jgi:16S rRNA (cytosine967-C5)-methyltransferase
MKKGPRAYLQETLFRLLERAQKTVAEHQALDVFLTQQLRQKNFSSRDRRLLSGTVFSWFRWWGWVRQMEALGPETQAAFAYLLDGQEKHPLIDEFLSRSLLGEKGVYPLGRAGLAEKRQTVERWLSDLRVVSFSSAPELLLPEWVAEELYFPPGVGRREHLLQCLEAFQRRPPTWLAVEKAYLPALVEELARQGLGPEIHPRLEGAVAVRGTLNLAPARKTWRGMFFVQDLASQAVVKACAAGPGESWWDVCAGAGGKTLGLLRSMKGRGRVLATDQRAGVLGQLARRAQEASARGLSTGVMDVTMTTPTGDDFDGVLVDAPCSALGTWSRNPDARWRTRRGEISAKAELQLSMLRRAAGKVKPGGTLVYAVCTLTRKETEGVLNDFLTVCPAFSLQPLAHPLSGDESPGFFWIWPWEGPADGMFIARLIRATS